MRTTVTLDDDVAAKLSQAARERGVSFKTALNDAVRAGLAPGGVARRYRMRAHPMGARAGVDFDRALDLASELEDRELARKLQLRK